jgi:hypothetical protein
MEMKDYLPIGSVVVLKEGEKKLMIFGILQNNEDDETEVYDYIGVPYPEGNMGEDYQYLFFHKDIDKVFFRGYEDEERAEFVQRLIEYSEN